MSDYLVDDLKDSLARGLACFVVGSGITIAATGGAECASWTGLLHHGVKRCESVVWGLPDGWGDKARERIDSGKVEDLLPVATDISERLGAPDRGEWSRWLKDSVGALKTQNPTPEVLQALRDLNIPLLVTTNYDSILTEVTGRPPVPWTNKRKVHRVLRGYEQGIIHLHGHWDTPESVVLGIQLYEKVLGDEYAQTLQKALVFHHSLVFIGCGPAGLQDPNFGALLEWMGRLFAQSECRHFWPVREGELETARAGHPPEQRLFPLSYGPDHKHLAGFLRSLGSSPIAGPLIPAAPQCFGRDKEIKELVATIVADKPEPTIVLGGPGIGKTALTRVALNDERVSERFGARRYLIWCEGAKSCSELVATIGRAVGLPTVPDMEPQVLNFFDGPTPTLLILDNLESPWEPDIGNVEEFLRMLAGCPQLALVVSIRGLESPGGVSWSKAIPLDPLDLASAQKAFLAIAGRKFTDDERLADLCTAVEQVPLAINLLAHAAEAEPNLEGVWHRWKNESTAPIERHGVKHRLFNLELSFEISIKGPRMDNDARRMLSVLARLPDGLAHEDLLHAFSHSLSSVSTLRQVGLAFDEPGRLRTLAPLREYVAKAYPSDDESWDAIVSHFVGLVLEHAGTVGREGGAEAVKRLAPEAGNVEAILPAALEEKPNEKVISAAVDWGQLVRLTGLGSTRPLEAAILAAESLQLVGMQANCIAGLGDIARERSDHDQARELFETAITLYQKVRDILGEATCIFGLGRIARERSDHEQARERYEMAITLYQKVGDILGEANCIRGLGDIDLARSDHDQARERYETAMPLLQKVGDILGEAHCIGGLGDIARERSDHDQARERYEMAITLYQQVGSILGEANCIRGLGDIALERSDHEQARERYETAMPLYQKVGDILGEANCIRGLGDIDLARSDHDQARERYETAMPLYQKVGDILGEATCIFGLGDIALERSDHEQARERYEMAITLYQQVGSILGEANCIRGLGDIARERSDHDQARERYETAMPLYQKVGDILGEADCIRGLGDIALARPDHDQARERYETAMPLYQKVGDILGEADCIRGLGDIALARPDHDQARERYETTLAMYERIPRPYSIGITHRRLARMTRDDEQRRSHLQMAREAWRSINRPDLIRELESEFGDV